MGALREDVRFGIRRLRSRPGFTIAAVATLALGIGANVAIFSVIHGVLLSPLPYAKGEELVRLRQHPQKTNGPVGFSPVELHAFQKDSKTLSTIAEYHSMYFILLGRKEPMRVATGVVSHTFFGLLGIRPVAGRAFLPTDERPEAEPVLILSHKFWKQTLGGPADIVGKTFAMNDRTHTVIGVLPPLPAYPDDNDVWMTSNACPFRSDAQTVDNPRARMLALFARVKPNVPPASVLAELDTLSRRVGAEHPDAFANGPLVLAAAPVKEEMTSEARPTLLLLLGTTGLVLMIACANVANLTLAQLMRREHELAVRSALGAGRGRLIRQLVTESVLVSLTGGALGLLFASWGRELLVRYASRFTPRAADAHIDASVLLFALGVSLVSGVVFGLVPALPRRMSITPALLAGSNRMSSGGGGVRTRSLLIVSQVAISFVLLIGAGLLVRSLLKIQEVKPGIDPERVLTMRVDLNFTKYQSPEQRRAFGRQLLDKLKARPGVVSVALGGTFPFSQQGPFPSGFVIEGHPVPKGQPQPQALVRVVSPEYFDTMRVPLLDGRAFTEHDGPEAPQVAIVSRALAKRHWGNAPVLGKRLSGDGEHWITVVGVAEDVRQQLHEDPKDEVYLPTFQNGSLRYNALVRTQGDPRLMARNLKDAVTEIDPDQPVDSIRTLEEARSETLAPRRLTVLLLGVFAAVALLITATGIGGVVAYSVTERTHEIGIRMALGAQRGDVLRLVVGPSVGLVALGLTLGVAGAFALTRFLAALLFGIGPTDPLTFISVALVLSAVALASSLVPARRATAIEPILALRSA